MVDIIGYMKIDESKPERIKQLVACIRSYAFLEGIKIPGTGHSAQMIIGLQTPSASLLYLIEKTVQSVFPEGRVININSNRERYGEVYDALINLYGINDFVINFMEDQFMVMDDRNDFMELINEMRACFADVCKLSFYDIEEKCRKHVVSMGDKDDNIHVFENTNAFHMIFQEPYTRRYWLGVNFLTTKKFALKFWNRPIESIKPHDYEVEGYHPSLEHCIMIPRKEVQAAIDDDHDEPNSSLLNRDNKKFKRIMAIVDQQFKPVYESGMWKDAAVEIPDKQEEDCIKIGDLKHVPSITKSGLAVLDFIINGKFLIKESTRKLSVFEFGMGGSTLYFAGNKNVSSLITVEHNQKWYDRVTEECKPEVGVYYGRITRPYNHFIDQYADEAFDIIMIDGVDKLLCIMTAIPKLKYGGILIINSLNTDELNQTAKLMEGWLKVDCPCDEDEPYADLYYYPWTTSIFQK